jgi:hypothetical protein
MRDIEAKLDSLLVIQRIVSRVAATNRYGYVNLDHLKFSKEPISYRTKKNKVLIEAHDSNGIKHKAMFTGESHNDGFWLEPLAAAAILNAGRKKVKDLIVGPRWMPLWWKPQMNYHKHRTELDIIVNWGGHVLGVSCKQGFGKSPEDRVHRFSKACTDISGIARTVMGRFCLPILICPDIPELDQVPSTDKLLKLRIDELADPVALAARIDEYIGSKSTTR